MPSAARRAQIERCVGEMKLDLAAPSGVAMVETGLRQLRHEARQRAADGKQDPLKWLRSAWQPAILRRAISDADVPADEEEFSL